MLKLNVGISRKVGQPNYGSRGAAVSFEAEVESALTSQPAALQERIHALFRLADAAVATELGESAKHDSRPADSSQSRNGNGTHHSEIHTHQNNYQHNQENSQRDCHDDPKHDPQIEPQPHPAKPSNRRPATASQCRAIHAISSQLPLDLSDELRQHYGATAPGELSLLEASNFIDWLKSQQDYSESSNNESNNNESNTNQTNGNQTHGN